MIVVNEQTHYAHIISREWDPKGFLYSILVADGVIKQCTHSIGIYVFEVFDTEEDALKEYPKNEISIFQLKEVVKE